MSSRCQKPIQLRNLKSGGMNEVPCGRCLNCKKRRISNWSFRLMQEDKVSDSAYFLTLTYDLEHCPITKNGYMDLRKSDLQKFFKRLRRDEERDGVSRKSLKYYAVGEYGGRYMRPHYHIILFNARLETLIGSKLAENVKRGVIELDGKRPFMCDAWSPFDTPIGHITIGKVSEASVGYTMKYISKASRVPVHRNDDRTPEFSLMSKGLGETYLSKAMVHWHKSDIENRQYCMLKDGKKISMPRYYRNKILNQTEMDELETLRLFNIHYEIDEGGRKYDNTAIERSEAYYAGLDIMQKSQSKNQKF